MEQRTTIGIDLAKEVFAICVLSPGGAVVESRTMRRAAFERWLVGLARRAGRGHGSMQQRSPLGAPTGGGWAYGSAHGAGVCRAIPQERQE